MQIEYWEIHVRKSIITIKILDIIQHAFYLKHTVSETGFCLRFQVVPTD
jgi:hypothetical protein